MTEPASPDQRTPEQKWAPWWVYLIVLLGANYLRAYLVPADSMPLVAIVALAVGQALLLFVLVTAIWRGSPGRS